METQENKKTEVLNFICDKIKEQAGDLPEAEIDLGQDINFDSLLADICIKYDLDITEDEIDDVKTPDQLADYVCGRLEQDIEIEAEAETQQETEEQEEAPVEKYTPPPPEPKKPVAFKVMKADLATEFKFLAKFIERKNTIPVLSNILIKAEQNPDRVTLIATNLDKSLECLLTTVAVSAPGAIVMPFQEMKDTITGLDNGEVKFEQTEEEVKSDKIRIISGEGDDEFTTSLIGTAPEHYPSTQACDKTRYWIRANELARLIDQTAYAITKEESRYALNGVLLIRVGDKMRMVGTDGHRLAVAETDKFSSADEFKLIVPKDTLIGLRELLKEKGVIDEYIQFDVPTDNHIGFKIRNRLLVSRTLAGQFPNYEMVLPKDLNRSYMFSGAALAKVLPRLDKVTDARSHGFSMFFAADGKLHLGASSEGKQAHQAIPFTHLSGEPEFIVGLNLQYLLDFLKTLGKDEKVIYEAQSGESPILLRPESQAGYKYVLMPMRLLDSSSLGFIKFMLGSDRKAAEFIVAGFGGVDATVEIYKEIGNTNKSKTSNQGTSVSGSDIAWALNLIAPEQLAIANAEIEARKEEESRRPAEPEEEEETETFVVTSNSYDKMLERYDYDEEKVTWLVLYYSNQEVETAKTSLEQAREAGFADDRVLFEAPEGNSVTIPILVQAIAYRMDHPLEVIEKGNNPAVEDYSALPLDEPDTIDIEATEVIEESLEPDGKTAFTKDVEEAIGQPVDFSSPALHEGTSSPIPEGPIGSETPVKPQYDPLPTPNQFRKLSNELGGKKAAVEEVLGGLGDGIERRNRAADVVSNTVGNVVYISPRGHEIEEETVETAIEEDEITDYIFYLSPEEKKKAEAAREEFDLDKYPNQGPVEAFEQFLRERENVGASTICGICKQGREDCLSRSNTHTFVPNSVAS